MANEDHAASARVRWARLRFQILGPLMAAPADDGELKTRIAELAARAWRHPTTGESIRFSFKTIERWWYIARGASDPLAALARKVPSHAGTHPSLGPALAEAIAQQHRDHPRWSFQLHHDNLLALVRDDTRLGPLPGYATLCRFMKAQGLVRARPRRHREHADGEPFAQRETRSYEVTHVHGLWHLDFHEGSRPVLAANGQWQKPQLLGVLDDRSRLCCHLQWYLDETAEALIHALSQAFQKRGLPRALLTDNGAAMIAAETVEGLERLGILHHTTLPYSPEQNGKQSALSTSRGLQRGLGIAAEDRCGSWGAVIVSRDGFNGASASLPRIEKNFVASLSGMGQASTGPRHRCRGSRCRRRPKPRPPTRFNGASASLPRIALPVCIR